MALGREIKEVWRPAAPSLSPTPTARWVTRSRARRLPSGYEAGHAYRYYGYSVAPDAGERVVAAVLRFPPPSPNASRFALP